MNNSLDTSKRINKYKTIILIRGDSRHEKTSERHKTGRKLERFNNMFSRKNDARGRCETSEKRMQSPMQ